VRLLIGFFLPGDSLLFTVGLLISQGVIGTPLWLACLLMTLAAIAGNVVGYAIGARAGPAILSRPDSRLFKQSHVDKTRLFFDTYGNRAIVLARFVPIVRTFITVVAGVAGMSFRASSRTPRSAGCCGPPASRCSATTWARSPSCASTSS
jgi:membrane-associated protein